MPYTKLKYKTTVNDLQNKSVENLSCNSELLHHKLGSRMLTGDSLKKVGFV